MKNFIENINKRELFFDAFYTLGLALILWFCKVHIAYLGVGFVLMVYARRFRFFKIKTSVVVFLSILFLFSSCALSSGLPYVFSTPILAFAILITLLFTDIELSFLMISFFGLLSGVFLQNHLSMAVVSIFSGFVTALLSLKS